MQGEFQWKPSWRQFGIWCLDLRCRRTCWVGLGGNYGPRDRQPERDRGGHKPSPIRDEVDISGRPRPLANSHLSPLSSVEGFRGDRRRMDRGERDDGRRDRDDGRRDGRGGEGAVPFSSFCLKNLRWCVNLKYVEPWPVASAILSVWGRRRRPPARREERPPSRRRGGRPDDRRPRSAEAWRPKRFPNCWVVGGVGVFLCWKCLEMPAATWTYDKDPRQGRRRRVKRGPRSDSRVRIPRVPDSSRYESLGDVNLYEVQEMT